MDDQMQINVQLAVNAEAVDLNTTLSSRHTLDTSVPVFNALEQLKEFENRFPDTMKLFEAVGIHPTKSTTVFNPYTGKQSEESFTNIGEHCIAVAHCASKIADAMAKEGLITSEQADYIVERALVHDLSKPYEIMRKNAEKAGLSEDVYSVNAYEKLKPLLEKTGVSSDVASYLVQAGRETGHNSLKDFITTSADGMSGLIEGRLAEKIVHLADDMTFTSNPRGDEAPTTVFLTPWERMLASNFIEKYPWLWKEGLALSEEGEVSAVRDTSKLSDNQTLISSYADLQVTVARGIARELQLYLAPESNQTPEEFVKKLVRAN